MREIKFRAWKHVDTPEMFNDVQVIDFKSGIAHLGYSLSSFTERIDKERLDNLILMQFTGLKDKNGVEIYEGDIIAQRWNDAYLNIKEIKFGCFEDPVDYFNYDGVGFYVVGNDGEENGTLSYMVKFADYEVIGNIYEDKELRRQWND